MPHQPARKQRVAFERFSTTSSTQPARPDGHDKEVLDDDEIPEELLDDVAPVTHMDHGGGRVEYSPTSPGGDAQQPDMDLGVADGTFCIATGHHPTVKGQAIVQKVRHCSGRNLTRGLAKLAERVKGEAQRLTVPVLSCANVMARRLAKLTEADVLVLNGRRQPVMCCRVLPLVERDQSVR